MVNPSSLMGLKVTELDMATLRLTYQGTKHVWRSRSGALIIADRLDVDLYEVVHVVDTIHERNPNEGAVEGITEKKA